MPNSSHDLALCLPNGMTLRLIAVASHHAMSNVSLAVGAGYFYDPQDCPGLSHLLEHCMFMGSTQYRQPNAVIDQIESYGGNLNAFTSMEHTNYHLSVDHAFLYDALRTLFHFVAQPLFEPTAVLAEIRNIDAEFKEKLHDDLRKINDVLKETCNPAHPFSKFSVGNAEIFSRFNIDRLVNKLRQYHTQHYCANNMSLCITTSLPLDEVLQFVTQQADIFRSYSVSTPPLPPLYLPSQTGVKIGIKTLQTTSRLILTVDLGKASSHNVSAHTDYLSHLFGDEGPGSIISALRRAQLANNLIVGTGIAGTEFCEFNINIQLSEHGQNYVDRVQAIVFAAIQRIKDATDHEWRFIEKQQLNKIAKQYSEHVYSIEMICELAEQLLTADEVQLHSRDQNTVHYSATVLSALLAKFTRDNMRIVNISPNVLTDKVSRYYQTPYNMKRLAGSQLTSHRAQESGEQAFLLNLPSPNLYLCNQQELVLKQVTQPCPNKLITKQFDCLWFAQDNAFSVPRGDIFISLDCIPMVMDITMTAAKRVWLEMVNQQIKEYFYSAEIAGLKYHLYGHQGGFTLHTSGFAAKQPILCEKIADLLMSFDANNENFSRARENQIALQKNALYNKPINRLFARLSSVIQINSPVAEQLSSALENLSVESIAKIPSVIRAHHASELLMHGNWVEQDATSLHDSLTDIFGDATHQPISRGTALLPVGEMLYHEVQCQHNDAAVVLYLQAPNASLQHTALCMVLEQMLAAPFFSSLRTEKQIGYSVATGFAPYNKHPGIVFQVQSPALNAQEIVDEIVKFLFAQLNELEFYEQYWPHIKRNLLRQLLETDLTFAMKSQRYWTNLAQDSHSFNRNHDIAEVIRSLSFNDIYNYAERVSQRKVFGELVVYSCGNKAKLNKHPISIINNIEKFKHLNMAS